MSVSEYGATSVGQRLVALVKSGGNAADYKKQIRAKCKHGRELSFVLIMCAALERKKVTIEEADFQAASDMLKKNETGATEGADCFDEELAGLKKLKASLDPTTKSMTAAAFKKKYLDLYNDADSSRVSANEKKLAEL
jgi:hypothetical protein